MTRSSTATPSIDAQTNVEESVKSRILIVDDEPSMREMLRIVLRRDGYDVTVAANGTQAIDILKRERVDLLLSDIRMPDVSGVDVLRTAKDVNHDLIAFMMTAFASTDTAVEAMRLGAADYFTKPFSMDEMRLKVRQHLETLRLKRENVLLKRALNTSNEFCNIIGRSESMLDLYKMVETIAKTNSTVLLTGESGTGKDLVARAVHYNSLRRERPFVALNCGGLPETLLESELFGHMPRSSARRSEIFPYGDGSGISPRIRISTTTSRAKSCSCISRVSSVTHPPRDANAQRGCSTKSASERNVDLPCGVTRRA